MAEEQETEVIAMSGRLDKVDLRARHFRIQDDVGHDITIEDVIDLDTAARLIGRRVIARGVTERAGGKVARTVEPMLTLEALPGGRTRLPAAEVPLGGVVPRGGVSGVTSEEVDDFLAELRA